MRDRLVIASVDPRGPEAIALLREAAIEARTLYPELIAPNAPMPTNAPLQQRAAYFVASLGQLSIGCGALQPLDQQTAEVRRMYVLKSHRRCGVARALMEHLERAASILLYTAIRLETGNRQLPAMALYESFGFLRIPPFGEHAGDPTSVCYEKSVSPTSQP